MLLKGQLRIKCHSQYIQYITPNINILPIIYLSFSTVPPMVNGDDWGCIVRDLETIIVLVLLAFNIIPQRLHHTFTLTRSRFRDSATVTRAPGDGTTKVYILREVNV